ncbi:MAG: sulfotransferase [Methylococcaceae bacterium]|nr:sulfotransferase [Methylococcaceae bacterium]
MTNYLQRGYIAIQAKNTAEAAEWFQKAVEADPKDAQAKACLGQSLCWLGRRAEGLQILRQSGQLLAKKARKTKDIGQLLGLTEQLQHWNDYQGALELGRQAVDINRAEVRGFQLLTLTHWRLNQAKQALETARQAVRLAPQSATLQILLATLEAQEKLTDSARKRFEKVLLGPLSPEEKFRAHKELGRLLDKVGDYGPAFRHLDAAGEISALLPQVKAQNQAQVPAMLRAHRAGFDRELMGRWASLEFPADQPAPIFLLGFMRSGTTLTQEVLDAHSQIFVADETDFIYQLYQELNRLVPGNATTPERLRSLGEAEIRQLRAFYWGQVRARYGDDLGGRRLVDKTTMNTIDLGLINVVFPDARILFVMRDPRDVCLSCFSQVMIPTPSTVHLLTWEGTARFYAQVMEWWGYVKGEMVTPYIEFRYEDAVTEFEATFRRVFEFLGLDWDGSVADFHRRAAGKYINSPSFSQVAQPLYSSSISRWKHYAAEFEPIEPALAPFVAEFGY